MIIGLTILLLAGTAGASDIKARAEAVITADRNEPRSAAVEALKAIRDEELSPPRLKTYDTRTLELLFDATSIADERAPRPELLQALEDIFAQALDRSFIGNMVDGLYTRFVSRREVAKARALCKRFPSKTCRVPSVIEPATKKGPAVYAVSEDGKTLTYREVDLEKPIIVSSVSPGCHFSRAIVALILGDPRLVKLFKEHAVNIDSSPYSLDADELARANREGFKYEVLYRADAWKGFDFAATPQFYFVKGGKIVHHIDGGAPDEFKDKLSAGVGQAGDAMNARSCG